MALFHHNEKPLETSTKPSTAFVTAAHFGKNLKISSHSGIYPPHLPPDRYSEYSQASAPLNRGAGSTPSSSNVTSISKSLSHDLPHKMSVIPSGGISYPSHWAPSHRPCSHGPVGRSISCALVCLFHGRGSWLTRFRP